MIRKEYIVNRKDFIQIIKLRSVWRIDKRKGNYKLPNNEPLSRYITELVETQLSLDNLGIMKDGNMYFMMGGSWNNEMKAYDDCTIMKPFSENEVIPKEVHDKRIRLLVSEIIG